MANPRKPKRLPAGGIGGYLKRNPQTKYIAPTMILLFLLSIVPTIFLVLTRFTNYQLGWDFSRAKLVGFTN